MTKLILCLLGLLTASCITKPEAKVTIAVSANMQYAINELVSAFEAKHAIKVETTSSSSGMLTAQIKQGAPFDLFLSANSFYPISLYEDGFASSKPEIYAHGSLILWSFNKEFNLTAFSDLTGDEFETIAIANAETAPYGMAAVQALKNASLYDQLKSKLIVGESISQVNQYVQSNAVDVGITSKSVLSSTNIQEKGVHVALEKKLYDPIAQGMVILKHGQEKNPKNTKLFYNFMRTAEAHRILLKYGYDIN